jgi:hypothetical protein
MYVVAGCDVLLSKEDESIPEPKLEYKVSVKPNEVKNTFLIR